MTYFVRTEFLAGGWLKTHSVNEFDDPMAAIDFATAQTCAEVVSVKVYSNEEVDA